MPPVSAGNVADDRGIFPDFDTRFYPKLLVADF